MHRVGNLVFYEGSPKQYGIVVETDIDDHFGYIKVYWNFVLGGPHFCWYTMAHHEAKKPS